jgi:hypothetical protein
MTPEEFYALVLKKRYAIEHRPISYSNKTAFHQHTLGDYLHIQDIEDNQKRRKKMTLNQFYSIIAKKEGKKVQVSIGNIREIVKIINMLLSEGMGEKDLAKNKAANEKINAIILSAKDASEAKKKLEKHLKNKKNHPANSSEMSDKEFAKYLIDTYTNDWIFYFIRLEPRVALEKVTCPVLAVNGSKDLQVDANQNLPKIKAALEKAGNTDFTIKEYPNLNHLFQESETGAVSEYVKIEQTFSPLVLEDMTKWILERVK